MRDQSEKSMDAWLCRIKIERINPPGRPTLLTQHHLTTLENSTHLTKNTIFTKISHSYIPYHRTFFVTLTHVIWVCYIALNSNQYWHHSQKPPFFVCPWQINSNNRPLTITHIATSSDIRRNTDTFALTHTTVTTNRMGLTQ